jgi:hypothetical protein
VKWAETLGPLLFLVPWKRAWCRAAGVAGFVALHLGIILFMRLYTFPLVCIVGLVALLPSELWNLALARRTAEGHAPRPGPRPGRAWALARSALAATALAYVVVSNLENTPGSPVRTPASLRPVGKALRLDQHWALFAPAPFKENIWFRVVGTLADGSRVDLLNGEGGLPVDQLPGPGDFLYRNERWYNYMVALSYFRRNSAHIPHMADYLCREWNSRRPERAASQVSVHEYRSEIDPHRAEAPAPAHRVVFESGCDAAEPTKHES